LAIALAIRLTSGSPVLFVSERVGRNNQVFRLYKFRTMRTDTPQIATHLLKDPDIYLTRIGIFLRKTSLDELPQLFNILKGDMSFVGPRPVLANETELIRLRTESGVHRLIPGLTGWAQINGRATVDAKTKAGFDKHYMENYSFFFDMKIILITIVKVLKADGVIH